MPEGAPYLFHTNWRLLTIVYSFQTWLLSLKMRTNTSITTQTLLDPFLKLYDIIGSKSNVSKGGDESTLDAQYQISLAPESNQFYVTIVGYVHLRWEIHWR
jgi:hypothetical protein